MTKTTTPPSGGGSVTSEPRRQAGQQEIKTPGHGSDQAEKKISLDSSLRRTKKIANAELVCPSFNDPPHAYTDAACTTRAGTADEMNTALQEIHLGFTNFPTSGGWRLYPVDELDDQITFLSRSTGPGRVVYRVLCLRDTGFLYTPRPSARGMLDTLLEIGEQKTEDDVRYALSLAVDECRGAANDFERAFRPRPMCST